jgi:four helix bundle protein
LAALSPEALAERTYGLALRVIRLTDALPVRRRASRILGDQLLRSAVSVAANYEEARGAMSRPDFTAKIALAYKECRETVMLLRLIRDANLLSASRLTGLLTEAEELRAILGSSLKTTRNPQSLQSSNP